MQTVVTFSVTGKQQSELFRGRYFYWLRMPLVLLGASMNLAKKLRKPSLNSENDNIVELVEALQKIDTNASLAKLNETSISDNNGGRIVL